MTIFRKPELSLSAEPIPEETLAYYRQALESEIYGVFSKAFYRLVDEGKITPTILATRLDRNPSQISRWLTGPGNWRLESLSDLLVGIGLDPRRIVGRLRPRPNALVTEIKLLSTEQPAPMYPQPTSTVGVSTTLSEFASNAAAEADTTLAPLHRSVAPAQEAASNLTAELIAKIDEVMALIEKQQAAAATSEGRSPKPKGRITDLRGWRPKEPQDHAEENLYDPAEIAAAAACG